MARGFSASEGRLSRARESMSDLALKENLRINARNMNKELDRSLGGLGEVPGVVLKDEVKALAEANVFKIGEFINMDFDERQSVAEAIFAGIRDFEKNGPNSDEATQAELDADRSARIREAVEGVLKENEQSFIANVDAKSQTIYSYEPGSTFSNNWEYDEKDVGRAKAAYEDTKATAQSLALLASVDSMTKQGVSRKDALELREKHLPKFMEALQRLSVTAPTMVTTVSDMARISKEKGKGSKELGDVANKANGLKNGYNNIVFDLEAAQKDFVKDLRDKLGIYKK